MNKYTNRMRDIIVKMRKYVKENHGDLSKLPPWDARINKFREYLNQYPIGEFYDDNKTFYDEYFISLCVRHEIENDRR